MIEKIKYMLVNPKTTDTAEMKKTSENFNSLMNKIQTELNQKAQSQMSGTSGTTNGTEKTLAQKIDNAIKFLAIARDSLDYSAKFLESSWTNAPPDQKTGLEYLIKARKEFDDEGAGDKLIMALEHDFMLQVVGAMAQLGLGKEALENLLQSFLKSRREAEAEAFDKVKDLMGDQAEILFDHQEAILQEAEENLQAVFGLVDEERAGDPGA